MKRVQVPVRGEGNRSLAKAAKIRARDVSGPPPNCLEASARQIVGLEPNDHLSPGIAVDLVWQVLEGIQAGPKFDES